MSRMKARRDARVLAVIDRAKALEHDIRKAKYDAGLHNRLGHGALPSQLGWGQHKSRKDRVTLFDPWRH